MQARWQEHIVEYQNALLDISETASNCPILGLIDEICETNQIVILTGFGTSLIVAEKAAHHLRSIGVAAVSLHPTDAEHGDLGIVAQKSLIIVVSKSGKLDAFANFLQVGAVRECSIFVLTEGQNNADLSGDYIDSGIQWIRLSPSREADRFRIVPTVSVVKQLVTLDFIIEESSKKLNKTTEDFLNNHPSGNLGRYLSLPVSEFFSREEGTLQYNPKIGLNDVLGAIEKSKKGICVFLTTGSQVYGLLTEGDIRRLILQHGTAASFDDADMLAHINRAPRVIIESETVSQAWNQFKSEPAISTLIVVKNDGSYAGILHVRDLRP